MEVGARKTGQEKSQLAVRKIDRELRRNGGNGLKAEIELASLSKSEA